jgi:hypothetical protein
MKVGQNLRRFALSVSACVALTLRAPSAQAAYTTIVGRPTPFNETPEQSHERLLENIYGGNFTQNGVNFSNGTVTRRPHRRHDG